MRKDDLTFGERLADRRIAVGLSQYDLARLLGVKRGTVSSYEANKSYPKADKVIKLAEILEVSFDYLFAGVLFAARDDAVFSTDANLSVNEFVEEALSLKAKERETLCKCLYALKHHASFDFSEVVSKLLNENSN